jgi:molybdate transport system substrate-binding protein
MRRLQARLARRPYRAPFRAALAACLLAVAPIALAQDAVTVLAAASLTNAYEAIGKAYRTKTGATVRFSFAASSTLARQIEAGAPASVFASADTQWMDWAEQRRLIVPGSRRTDLGNALVLVTAGDRDVRVELRPGFDLAALLGPTGRLATGDPAHVPVGRYAEEALRKLGVWSTASARLVRADSVRAALALVERGEAPAGIVYATDAAIGGKVRVAATFPADTHAPIVYPVALVARGETPAARRFHEFLASDAAAAIARSFGFVIARR